MLRKVGFFLILSGGGSGTDLLAVSLFVALVNVVEVGSIGSRLILWRLRRLQHVVQDHLKSSCEAFGSGIVKFGLFNLLDKQVDKRKGGVLVKNGIGEGPFEIFTGKPNESDEELRRDLIGTSKVSASEGSVGVTHVASRINLLQH